MDGEDHPRVDISTLYEALNVVVQGLLTRRTFHLHERDFTDRGILCFHVDPLAGPVLRRNAAPTSASEDEVNGILEVMPRKTSDQSLNCLFVLPSAGTISPRRGHFRLGRSAGSLPNPSECTRYPGILPWLSQSRASRNASRFPVIEQLDQGWSHLNQKLPFAGLSPSGFTVAPSTTVHHHMQPSSNVIHKCLLGQSSRSRSALKSCVASLRLPNSALMTFSISRKSGFCSRALGTIFHPTCTWPFALATGHHCPRRRS